MRIKRGPQAPMGVAGLIDYRASIVPVLDLSALAEGRPAARRMSTRILVVRQPAADRAGPLLGLLAERATEIVRLAPETFQSAGVSLSEARYLGPVARDARGLLQRIEVPGLLTPEVRALLRDTSAEGA